MVTLVRHIKIDTICGDTVRVIKLGAFVASANNFFNQPVVVNAASDLMVAAFGEAGRHARFAVGTNALPLNCLVEIDGIFEIS